MSAALRPRCSARWKGLICIERLGHPGDHRDRRGTRWPVLRSWLATAHKAMDPS